MSIMGKMSLADKMQIYNSDIDKAVRDFSERLKVWAEAGGGHFEHSQWQWNSDIWDALQSKTGRDQSMHLWLVAQHDRSWFWRPVLDLQRGPNHWLSVLFKWCYWIGVVAWTFLNAGKSVGGHIKKYITSPFFNRITFYLAARCKTFKQINV